MGTPLTVLASEPFKESLQATAKRAEAHLQDCLHDANVVWFSKDDARSREYLLKIQRTCEKIAKDIEEGMRAYANPGEPVRSSSLQPEGVQDVRSEAEVQVSGGSPEVAIEEADHGIAPV